MGRAGCLAACWIAAWAALAAAQLAEPDPVPGPTAAEAPAPGATGAISTANEPTTTTTEPTPAGTAVKPADTSDLEGSVGPAEASSKDSTIEFVSDVRPILAAHCLDCHGAEKHSGGLRLDSREGAARGGDSGKRLLGGSLESNEIYARVSSSDRAYRMPKNADALSAEELDTIKRWVEQGTPWPTPAPDVSFTFYDEWLFPFADRFKRYETEYYYALPFGVGFLGLLFIVLVVLRVQGAYRRGRPWTAGRLSAFTRLCDRIRTTELLMALLLAAAVVVMAAGRAHQLKIKERLAVLQEANERASSPWSSTVYGYPPRPVRMDRPKRLSATYYRGNCERNPELFNYGNYLTSIFHVSLCDREHRPLGVGDVVPRDGVFLRCEIQRAPGTTDLLFSPEAMAAVMFTPQHHESKESQLEEEPTRLETLEPGQRWVAYVPLKTPFERKPWADVIYVYTGQVKDGKVHGTLHYGIAYQLIIADDKLTAESDLWMDSFGNSAFAPPSLPGLLPYHEWFTDQPLPVIVGENSKDPKLLGIDEHVQKGLIKPPDESKSKSSNAAPEKAPESPPNKPADQASSGNASS